MQMSRIRDTVPKFGHCPKILDIVPKFGTLSQNSTLSKKFGTLPQKSGLLREPFKKKMGNSLVFDQRGGPPPPPLARFGQFPVFSCDIFYCFKMILKV